MKDAGCWLIAFGVETSDQDILTKLGKRATVDDVRIAMKITREAGIKSSIYFMFGLPWDTSMILRQNTLFAKKINPDFLEIFYVYPFPGTPLYDFAIEKRLLKKGQYPKEAYSSPAMPTLYMSKDQLSIWRKRALRAFYLRPFYIIRTLIKAKSLKVIFNYIKYGFQQLFGVKKNGSS